MIFQAILNLNIHQKVTYRMTFNIRFKLFTTLLLATGSVVLCMYLMMLWSFDRGFLDYVNKQDEQKYQLFSQELAKYWQQHKSWRNLGSNRFEWDKLLIKNMDADIPTFPVRPNHAPNENAGRIPREHGSPRGRPPQNDFSFSSRRPPENTQRLPILLNEDKEMLIGQVRDIKTLKLHPITVDGRDVGYLGQIPRNKLSDELDLLFLKQQSKAFMLLAFVMVIVCFLVGFPIAAHLVKPIKRLTEGTQKLIAGDFKTIIPVTSHDELGMLSNNFNSLANTLKENEKIRRQWLADISHELRTPLAILKGEIEAIQDGIRPSTPEAISSLHSEIEHLNNLINDLYELSMSDIGALNYKKSNINPLIILQSTIDSFEMEFKNSGIDLLFNQKLKNQPMILGDSVRLKQLFSNILKNTLRYTNSPGKLEIQVEQRNTSILFHFKDSSPGVDLDEYPLLFDRLYRVESSRNRATGGAGLGLSICKNIVTAHNGEISAKASPYGGIWVSIQLPISKLK